MNPIDLNILQNN